MRTRPSENLPAGLPGKVRPYGCFQELESDFLMLPVSAYESPNTNSLGFGPCLWMSPFWADESFAPGPGPCTVSESNSNILKMRSTSDLCVFVYLEL